MTARSEIVTILETGDIAAAREFWRRFPHMPQPKDDSETRVLIHLTRTGSKDVAFKYRAYSHSWLLGEGYKSLLPDELRPEAQRLYPTVAPTVGISVNSKWEQVKKEVQGAMQSAVLEAEADGKLTDDLHVRARMKEARERAQKALNL